MNIKLPTIKDTLQKKTISGENFFVGKGAIIFNNCFIALDAIATITLQRIADIPIGKLWYWLFGGIVAFIIGIAVKFVLLIIAGLLVAVGSGIQIYDIKMRNKLKSYKAIIRLINNDQYEFEYKDLNFAQDVINVIIECINDRKGGYNIVNNSIQYVDDHSIGKVGFVGGTYSATNVGRDFVQGDKTQGHKVTTGDNSSVTYNETLNENDWKQLEEFLLKRKGETEGEQNGKCEELLEKVKKKDKEGIKKMCYEWGAKKVKSIFTDNVTTAVKRIIVPIVNKILK